MPSKDNSIQVTVNVEDFEEQIQLKLEISNHETIKQLKEKIFVEYQLPKENQVWIINDLIPNDETKISSLNHTNIFYLILTSFIGNPEIKVTPEKQEIKKEQIKNLKSDSVEIKKEQIKNFKTDFAEIKKEQAKNLKSDYAEIEYYEKSQKSDKLQWSCERCTFLNLPKHKICQMCNTKKNDQYFNAVNNNYLKQRKNSLFDFFDHEDKNMTICNNCNSKNSIDKRICSLCLVLLPSQKELKTVKNFMQLSRQNSKSLTNLNKKYKSSGNLNKSEDDSSDDYEQIFRRKN